jgi:NTP pyrophosphatase (non-canonical NTP hydrolase)
MANYADLFNDFGDEIYDICERKGFWEEPFTSDNLLTIPAKLDLVHDELCEAQRVHRERYDDTEEDPISGMTEMQEEDFAEELGDAVIRILDLARAYDLDIGAAIVAKVEKNATRPHKHGKRY